MCPNGNADLTRSLIINSAIQIVSQDGLSALTAGRLIEQAGISKGGLYHHFRTMQEVEIEVLERLLEIFSLQVNDYQDPDSLEEFVDSLETMLFDLLVKNAEHARALFAFMSEAANNPKVKVLLRSLSDDLVLNWQRQLSSLKPAESIASLNNTAQVIATIQTGLMTRFFITQDMASLKSYWRGCRATLEGMLSIAVTPELESQPEQTKANLIAANISQ